MHGVDQSSAVGRQNYFSNRCRDTEPRSISLPLIAIGGCVMKIVLRVAGPLFIAVGLFWFARGTGLLPWPHNSAMVDYGAGVAAVGIGLVWFGWQ
jgi:hypothetical protein